MNQGLDSSNNIIYLSLTKGPSWREDPQTLRNKMMGEARHAIRALGYDNVEAKEQQLLIMLEQIPYEILVDIYQMSGMMMTRVIEKIDELWTSYGEDFSTWVDNRYKVVEPIDSQEA